MFLRSIFFQRGFRSLFHGKRLLGYSFRGFPKALNSEFSTFLTYIRFSVDASKFLITFSESSLKEDSEYTRKILLTIRSRILLGRTKKRMSIPAFYLHLVIFLFFTWLLNITFLYSLNISKNFFLKKRKKFHLP
jgi:hypothetical protein